MKLAIFSDIHGNLPALQSVLEELKNEVDGYICLGDVVGYGPWANECVDIITNLPNTIYIEGNHERYFLSGVYEGDNIIAKTFFDYCYPLFNKQGAIKDLKKKYQINDYTLIHTIQNRNIYQDSDVILDRNYIIGHSHHQFEIEQPPFKLYNTGSVGQNRKYINVANYLTLETQESKIKQCEVIYDENEIINEMLKKNYPSMCVDYYRNKKRQPI